MNRPRLGIQGPVMAWDDPWSTPEEPPLKRTGTHEFCSSQDPPPTGREYARALAAMGADFTVHHVTPGTDVPPVLLSELAAQQIGLVLGNEYGNINGAWIPGTNRYDVPDEAVARAVETGICEGLLYDEPAHLQINCSQYRKDGWFGHWATTHGLSLVESRRMIEQSVRRRTEAIGRATPRATPPLITEHVFPVMFHSFARAGADLCPKIMKESFQPLQLGTAIGAARQYGRKMWICADLWGPDVGAWFTRYPGFPGHSPQEFASALRMGYLMGPTHLFVENVDVLLRHGLDGFGSTEFGEVWKQFVRGFIPEHRLVYSHADARPDIVVIHSDDGNYGQGGRSFGNRLLERSAASDSLFEVWHFLSHGTIPAHGSCMHIPGFTFPRGGIAVRGEEMPLPEGPAATGSTHVHGLFFPMNNVIAYDEFVGGDTLARPRLILVAGTSVSERTLAATRRVAEDGATVIIGRWLIPDDAPAEMREAGRAGRGLWTCVDSFLSPEARETAEPFLGASDVWFQRLGDTMVRMRAGDSDNVTLDIEVSQL